MPCPSNVRVSAARTHSPMGARRGEEGGRGLLSSLLPLQSQKKYLLRSKSSEDVCKVNENAVAVFCQLVLDSAASDRTSPKNKDEHVWNL